MGLRFALVNHKINSMKLPKPKKLTEAQWIAQIKRYCKQADISPEDLIECHKWLRWLNRLPKVDNLPNPESL